jgi:hypothetical protein
VSRENFDACLNWSAQPVDGASMIPIAAATANAWTETFIPNSSSIPPIGRNAVDRWVQDACGAGAGRGACMRPSASDIPDTGVFVHKPYTERQIVSALNEMARRLDAH